MDPRRRRLPAAPAARPRARSRRWPAAAAARAPARWPATTRTPPRWASRRPVGAPRRRPGAEPLWFSTTRPPTSTRPTPPPSTPPCAASTTSRLRRRRLGALGDRGAPARARRAARHLVVVAPTCAPACRQRPTRRDGGDGPRPLLVGGDDDAPVLAESLGGGSATEEFLDRWRTPGDARSKVWEERFGETRYVAARRPGVGRAR